VLPAELLKLPDELARVDGLLDDPAFFAPFVPFFDPRIGRPSTPMETYLRLMFLKFRYRLGYESLGREVSDSITWRRFCRIGLDGSVPHPTTLMQLTTRCGNAAVDGLNEALLAKAAEAKLLRTSRIRADTTVVPANVAYPTDSGLLDKAMRRITATGERIRAAGGTVRTRVRDRSAHRKRRPHQHPQAWLRLGSHPHRRHRRRPNLDRARRPDPQPGQDQCPRRVIDSAQTTPTRQTGHDPTQPLSTGAGFQVEVASEVSLGPPRWVAGLGGTLRLLLVEKRSEPVLR
jgi:IS5 family transposase